MNKTGGLLNSEEWAGVLDRGFGASQFHADIGETSSARWTVFSRYGVRVGYACFPVGYDNDLPEAIECPDAETLRAGMDVARFSSRSRVASAQVQRYWRCDLPETCIEDLEGWDESRLPAVVRRKISKSLASGVHMRSVGPADGPLLHALYAETIERQKGRLRYTREYFNALVTLAVQDAQLLIGIVLSARAEPSGFIVIAHHGDVSYYLHGGYLSHVSALRPGYVAMAWAIKRSREFGRTRFNMLTSPVDQPSLVAYKESFGGRTYPRRYYEYPLTLRGQAVSRTLALAARLSGAKR